MDAQKLNLFEGARSTWNIRVSGPEMRRVMQTMVSMNHGVKDPVMWVQKIGPATRRWFSNSFKLNVHFDAAGTEMDPESPVALPLSFLAAVNQLTNTYGTAEIFLNVDEGALTATWGGEYVVFDQTVDVNTPAPFDPRFMDIVSSHRRYEKVSVRSDVLARIADQYQAKLQTIEDIDGPPSFITLRTEHNHLRWTTDWSRWDRGRVSGYSTASTWINHFEVKFYPVPLFTFLDGIPHEEEVVIGTVDPEFSFGKQYFGVIGLDWAAWCPVENEDWERWGRHIRAAFKEFGFEFGEIDPLFPFSIDHEIRTFVQDDVEIAVSIVDGSAGPDCIRLQYAVQHNCFVTPGIYTEIMRINNELVNARLTVDGSSMTLIVDVDNPDEESDIGDGIKSVLTAIGQVAEADELLPLFGGNRPKDELDREIDEILDALEDDDTEDESDDESVDED